MIGVAKGLSDDSPSLIPFQSLKINEDPLQLDDCQRAIKAGTRSIASTTRALFIAISSLGICSSVSLAGMSPS